MGSEPEGHHNTFEMEKEFVIKSIDSTGDGSPHVVVSLSSSKDLADPNSMPPSPFGSKVMGFTNMGDMMKDLNKMLAGNAAGVTSIKMDIHEYKKMGLAVGDRVRLTMAKIEALGV